jgi:hypothetical protein
MNDLKTRLRKIGSRTGLTHRNRDTATGAQAAAYIEKLEASVMELLQSNWDKSWPTMRKYDTFEEYAKEALEK